MMTSTTTEITNSTTVTSNVNKMPTMPVASVSTTCAIPSVAPQSIAEKTSEPSPEEGARPERIIVSFFDRLDIKKVAQSRGLNPENYYLKSETDALGKKIRTLTLQPDVLYDLNEIKSKIVQQFSSLIRDLDQFTIEKHIKGCIETMVDGKDDQDDIMLILENDEYCSNNLKSITFCENNKNKMKVSFLNGDIYFSNRSSSYELRGNKLKELLLEKKYTSIGDFIRQLHMTKDDQYLIAMSHVILMTHTRSMENSLLLLLKKELMKFDVFNVPIHDLLPDFFDVKE